MYALRLLALFVAPPPRADMSLNGALAWTYRGRSGGPDDERGPYFFVGGGRGGEWLGTPLLRDLLYVGIEYPN
jgi:hypothetical protein